jgi:hypothetical protein
MANMMKGDKKIKYPLGIDGDFFLIVTYEAFQDESDGGQIFAQIRTVDFMGETSMCPDELPDWMMKNIIAAAKSNEARDCCQPNAKEIELPWGTLSEAARRLGISRDAATKGWKYQRRPVVDTVAEIVREHVKEEQEKRRAIAQVGSLLNQ